MVYVRAKHRNGRTYYYEQSSHRVAGKVKTKHIRYIGTTIDGKKITFDKGYNNKVYAYDGAKVVANGKTRNEALKNAKKKLKKKYIFKDNTNFASEFNDGETTDEYQAEQRKKELKEAREEYEEEAERS